LQRLLTGGNQGGEWKFGAAFANLFF
jgi:hypothetical protein